MNKTKKAGFGGGCHWCTEAVFQFLKGVKNVEQGLISSIGDASSFSEAVVVEYNQKIIPLQVLIEIHLLTHRSTSSHSFRKKYRSAVYYFDEKTAKDSAKILRELQPDFEEKIITQILPFGGFKPSEVNFKNYYLQDPERPFCKRYIHPKLKLLQEKYKEKVKEN